jgi:hypothetical protein
MESPDSGCFAILTDNASGVETMEAARGPSCVKCEKPFKPRQHGGGKPQKFCGEKCRTAHYVKTQRRKISRQDTSSSEAADKPPMSRDPRPRGPSSPCDEYDWKGAVVIREQQAIAMYWDEAGNLVIRQKRAWDEEYDSCIIINEHNAERFLVELSALMRTVSVDP